MPHPVWWMRTTLRVPSARWLMVSERITSSVTTPPALRMVWQSPSSRPSAACRLRRASMQATTATRWTGQASIPGSVNAAA